MIEKADPKLDPVRSIRAVYDRLYWYLKQLIDQFLDHDLPARAGALTYTTLFAVVPLMTVAYAMFSIMPQFAGVGEMIETFIFENLLPNSSSQLQEKLTEFSGRARGLTAIGGLFLFVTTFLLLVTIEGTFNSIWHVAEPRRGLQRFLVYWGVLSLGPTMIAAGIVISGYLFSMTLLTELNVSSFREVVLGYLPLILTCLGFTVLYYAVPNCHVPFVHALVGGLLTTLSFEVAKNIFNMIVVNSSMASIYGAFAAVPFFLAWLYMVWVLILCGAIFVRTLALEPELDHEGTEPVLIKCARVVQVLHNAHLRGESVSDKDITSTVQLNRWEFDRVLETMRNLRLLIQSDNEQWILGRSLKSLTLWDLYQALPEGLDMPRLDRIKDMDHVVEPLKSLVQFGSNQMSISLDTVFGGSR